MKKKIYLGAGFVTASIIGIGILSSLTPRPVITFARKTLFKIPKDIREKEYIEGNVHVYVNESYYSKYQNNFFDIYFPKYPVAEKPFIAWIHGGGFVGGDKLEEKEYATKLAEKGYTVAVMNYALVPETNYPIPVIQAAEFIKYLMEYAEEYSINCNNMFIAGDSAGAHIASQLILAQINEEYRQSLGIEKVISIQQIKGTLLYCGAYDLPEIVNNHEITPVKYIFDKIGWAYSRNKNWGLAELTRSTIVSDFITKDFPPTYITDGNSLSFEAQGKLLAKKLISQNVPVNQRFFDKAEYKTAHEYQFDLKKEPGKIAFQDTINFLGKYRQKINSSRN